MQARKEIQVFDEATLRDVISKISTVNSSVFVCNWRYEWFAVEAQGQLKAGWMVRLAFERPDTETGIMGWGYGRYEHIAQGAWESGVVKTCWLLLELMVRHELMEAYRYEKARIFNPHHGVLELATLEKDHTH